MPSKTHQALVSFIARKMQEDGYQTIAFDDDNSGFDIFNYPIPPTIKRHRPDIIGMDIQGYFSIGEAKTKNDLTGKRLEEQLNDFSDLRNEDGSLIPFYLGIPESVNEKLEFKLSKFNVNRRNIKIISIPDLLI
ncbi:MAG: hypothetical protein GF353_17125 [Candidatus Lokiarchaeota archaeon]|nr:hypothetical protein [Candidatus Lokiarchaeota archaeon]